MRRNDQNFPPGLTYEDLPAWMRRERREFDWVFWSVVVLIVVVVWPYLTRSGLPYNLGMHQQVAYTIEMAESMRSGILYPRWVGDFNYGLGSPLWNYLAPLPHYLSGLHYALTQTDPTLSVKASFVLGAFLNGIGMCCFVRRRWGDYAGFLSAAAYLFSPQILLVIPYLESDLAIWLAMGCFLMTLWAFDRVLESGRGWDIAVASLMCTGVVLSHAPLNIVLLLVVAGWLGWLRFIRRTDYHAWPKVALAYGLGLGLGAFYWLPAWLERTDFQWVPTVDYGQGRWYSLTLSEIFQQPARIDLHAVNPLPTGSIGVSVWGLAVMALLAIVVVNWRHTSPLTGGLARGDALQSRLVATLRNISAEQRESVYFGIMGLLLILVVSPLAASMWDKWPVWPPFHPHDLLALLAAGCCIVIGQLGYILGRSSRPMLSLVGLLFCGVCVLIPTLYIVPLPMWPRNSSADVTSILRDETQGHLIAAQMTGWLLPKSVETVPPQPSRALLASYQSNAVDKVSRSDLPAAVNVDVVEHRPQSERLVVSAPYEFTLVLQTLYFPGWSAEIDNHTVPVAAVPGTGLISLDMPEGQYEVIVRFGSTSIRRVAWIISAFSFLILLVVGFVLKQRSLIPFEGHLKQGDYKQARPMFLLLVMMVLGGIGLAVRVAPQRFADSSPRGVVLGADQQLPRWLQGGVDLLGYSVETGDTMHAGDNLAVHLYWRAGRPDLPDYQVNVSVQSVEDPSNRIAFAQHRHPGFIPTSQWTLWPLLDYFVRDSYYLQLDEDAFTGGDYQIVIQLGRCSSLNLFPCQEIDPLFVRDARGSRLGREIELPAIIRVEP